MHRVEDISDISVWRSGGEYPLINAETGLSEPVLACIKQDEYRKCVAMARFSPFGVELMPGWRVCSVEGEQPDSGFLRILCWRPLDEDS